MANNDDFDELAAAMRAALRYITDLENENETLRGVASALATRRTRFDSQRVSALINGSGRAESANKTGG